MAGALVGMFVGSRLVSCLPGPGVYLCVCIKSMSYVYVCVCVKCVKWTVVQLVSTHNEWYMECVDT